MNLDKNSIEIWNFLFQVLDSLFILENQCQIILGNSEGEIIYYYIILNRDINSDFQINIFTLYLLQVLMLQSAEIKIQPSVYTF